MKGIAIFMLGSVAGGCAPVEKAIPPSTAKSPIPSGWILVNHPYSELIDLDRAGQARIAPTAFTFVIEPVFTSAAREPSSSRSGCPHELKVLYAQPGPLGIGDIAEARVSIEGGLDEEHVISVAPTRPGIALLTPATVTIPPNGAVLIRFKGVSAGEGGVAVRILECRPVK